MKAVEGKLKPYRSYLNESVWISLTGELFLTQDGYLSGEPNEVGPKSRNLLRKSSSKEMNYFLQDAGFECLGDL